MERKDYILTEIEKIGAIISTIRQKLFGGKGNTAITLEKQFENEKGMLLDEVNFDVDKLLHLNFEELNEYISGFEGFNIENIELLAECFFQIGINDESDNSKKYLEKALQLYELCNLKSKTYSLERETHIKAIRNAL
ncbi:MAG: hypothetical protein LBQ60_07640 [Bacteroidales bacterium]|jgi:hypothetical protein|nr:hypothetical protein [Bacteroidales bacterium]